MRVHRIGALILIVAVRATLPAVDTQAQETKPNIILILADDLALGDLASRNGGISRTPNLDRLVANSVKFQQAYSASCVCAPARAALLTGRYPHRTGVVTLNMPRYPKLTRLKKDETTIADVLSRNGYSTGLVGKWHCGDEAEYHPLKRGFQEFEGFIGAEGVSYFNYKFEVAGKPLKVSDDYLTDDLSRRAIEFVRRHQRRPFFLHLAHYAPHRPLEAPEEAIRFYQEKGLDESTATIYAMIEIMDRGIGELMAELDRLNLSSKTLVIFASDNGPDPLTGTRFNENRHGMKYEIYEGGIRVPLFCHWPGTLKPGNRDQVVHFIDLFPTLLDICGVSFQPELAFDGVSLRDALFKNAPLPERQLFWQWNRGNPNYTHNAAVRDGNWKFVRPFVTRNIPGRDSQESPLLFNLSSDRKEESDLADKHPERRRAMSRALDSWTSEVEKDRRRQ